MDHHAVAAERPVVRLAVPLEGAEAFPPAGTPAAAGESLIVITAHPAGMDREVDKGVPVAQPCRIAGGRRDADKHPGVVGELAAKVVEVEP